MKHALSDRLKKKFSVFSPKEIMLFWYRHYKIVFSLVFFVVLGLAGYQWQYSLHRYFWDEEKKKEYIEATFKETRFKEIEFRELVTRLKQRQAEHEQDISPARDIFTGRSLAR